MKSVLRDTQTAWQGRSCIQLKDEADNVTTGKIKDKPALILEGIKDIAFRVQELNRWVSLFPDGKVIRYADAGHFVQDEKGDEMGPVIGDFMGKRNSKDSYR